MCTWLQMGDANAFKATVASVQRSFVSHMRLPDGIALNEALLENLFMILISILNRFPIFIIGKPGSSKSLAMQLIQVCDGIERGRSLRRTVVNHASSLTHVVKLTFSLLS
jgi:hypothetical protein